MALAVAWVDELTAGTEQIIDGDLQISIIISPDHGFEFAIFSISGGDCLLTSEGAFGKSFPTMVSAKDAALRIAPRIKELQASIGR